MNNREISHLRRFPPLFRASFSGFRHEFLGLFRAFAEEELLHFLHQERAGLGLDGGESVLVDEHGLVRDPPHPGFFGHVRIDPLAQFPGVREIVEAIGLTLQQNTLDSMRHGAILP